MDTYKKVIPGQPAIVVITQDLPKNDDAMTVLISAFVTKMTPTVEPVLLQPAPSVEPDATQIADQVMAILDKRWQRSVPRLPCPSRPKTLLLRKTNQVLVTCVVSQATTFQTAICTNSHVTACSKAAPEENYSIE